MTASPRLLLLAVLFSLPLAQAFAANPQGLEMDKDGVISIVTDSLEGITLNFGLTDTSGGIWHGPKVEPKYEPQSGTEIERSGIYEFSDGSSVEAKVSLKLKDSEISFQASWPSQSAALGFGMATLKVPRQIAEDLTVEVDGEVKVVNLDKGAYFKEGTDVVLKRTSTGQFLLKITGEQSGNSLMVQPDNQQAGLEIRMGGGQINSTISDTAEQSCTISFKQ